MFWAPALPLGVLIECDPSIKSIIVNIDSDNHDFIIEDLDEERVVVKENMVPLLKQKLEDVRAPNRLPLPFSGVTCPWRDVKTLCLPAFPSMQRLKENLPPVDESGSE
ncbi:putative AC transposase [Purpureocillium lavendulum]|uniref:General transcription and DNA repair factor IIH subunit TFB5 n=1 Tax=Purpureocillium lavendulum TaxID=1247861 RepID=A0AB34FMD2_9HYPO|nr:putative AC transposase [Purpureocillium lavendulum]